MNIHKKILHSAKVISRKYCNLNNKPYLPVLLSCCLFIINPNIALAQGYAPGGYGSIGASGMTGSTMPGTTGGGGSYYGAAQANIDHSVLNGNHEMLRNDIDYEDYLLQKRNAFAQQMQQTQPADDKLRAYAENRLKVLSAKSAKLSTAEQAESHDLMDWLKKDAEQRANNLAWLKRQDSEIAMVEQDQDVSFKNQRNSLHNMFEDSLNVESQYKWNQQMQLANLHQTQENNGVMFGSHQPFANQGYGAYGGYGYGFNGRWGW